VYYVCVSADDTQHFSGLEEAVFRNIAACNEMAQIPRTSFGPNGMCTC
jgi:T-complex protein 1 subunit theta